MPMQQSKVRLNFADGSAITSFISLKHVERFSDPLGLLEVSVRPPPEQYLDYRERLQKGELVALLVDDKPQASMVIHTVRKVISSAEGTGIDITCHSPIIQLFQSSPDPKSDRALKADAPLIDFVNEVVAPYGIGEVFAEKDTAAIKAKTGKGTNAADTPAKELKFAEARIQPNETAGSFLGRVITRLGVMMRMDPVGGGIYLTRPHYDQDPSYTVRCGPPGAGPAGDSFLDPIEVYDSNEQQHSFCEVVGEAVDKEDETSANIPQARVESSEINPDRPPYRATGALAHKPLFYTDKDSRDAKKSRSTAFLALGLKAETAFYVKGDTHGLVSREGTPWTIDTTGRVYIHSDGFDEIMWLSQRTWTLQKTRDGRGGQRTEHVWIPKGYLRLGEL
ncbi:MAG: hypothetical protein HOW73_47525 [Polyangiaceae bacterium]|nr:hypothetical protein [Polyangiaceae bacterium]